MNHANYLRAFRPFGGWALTSKRRPASSSIAVYLDSESRIESTQLTIMSKQNDKGGEVITVGHYLGKS